MGWESGMKGLSHRGVLASRGSVTPAVDGPESSRHIFCLCVSSPPSASVLAPRGFTAAVLGRFLVTASLQQWLCASPSTFLSLPENRPLLSLSRLSVFSSCPGLGWRSCELMIGKTAVGTHFLQEESQPT